MGFKTKTVATVIGIDQEFLKQDNVCLKQKDRLLLTLMKFPFKTKTKVSNGILYLMIPEWNNPAWWNADFFKYELEFPELIY